MTPYEETGVSTAPQDGALSKDDRNRLDNLLQKRLFKDPFTAEDERDLAQLLARDKESERDLTPEEQSRLKDLVRLLYRGVELDPKEQTEL